MKYISAIQVIFFLAFLSSCEEDNTERLWVGITETQCDNAWDNIGTESTEGNVSDYLRRNDIRIYDFKVEIYSFGPFCTACFCPSGRIIQVLIDKSDINSIKELGFEE